MRKSTRFGFGNGDKSYPTVILDYFINERSEPEKNL
jgi:hypothetical protein